MMVAPMSEALSWECNLHTCVRALVILESARVGNSSQGETEKGIGLKGEIISIEVMD